MNNIVKVLNTNDNTDIELLSKAMLELRTLEQKFLDKNDYVSIKSKTYIKKS